MPFLDYKLCKLHVTYNKAFFCCLFLLVALDILCAMSIKLSFDSQVRIKNSFSHKRIRFSDREFVPVPKLLQRDRENLS
jgi:hypothetical protein